MIAFRFRQVLLYMYGPGSSVSIATKVWSVGSGIESRLRRSFPPVQTGHGAHPASCNMYIYIRIYMYIQGVPGGMCNTSGGCSLGQNIPIKPKTPISKVQWLRRYFPEKFETLTAVTHLLITKHILKPAGICGFCNVNMCT